MRYLGIDVHSRASVLCMLDAQGEVVSRGETETSAPALKSLARKWMAGGRLVVGQGVGAEVLSFNAQQLRMIASSRKKSDRGDAYWIARALQTGMYPHPVYIPTGEIRELRSLLKRRRMMLSEHSWWHNRGRATLRGVGQPMRCNPRRLSRAITRCRSRVWTAATPISVDAVASWKRTPCAAALKRG